MREEKDPICPNSKCKKSNCFKAREIPTGTSEVRVFIIYCAKCGKIINTVS